MSRNQFYRDRESYHNYQRCRQRQHHKGDRTIFGIVILTIGLILLFRTLGIFYFDLALTWPVILMAIGLLIGIKSRFHNPAWWILILIGIANLTPQFTILGHPSTTLVWPAVLIVGGLAVMLRSPRRGHRPPYENINATTTTENVLNIDVTFGGKKEIVTSKDFRGGTITSTFGGVELNLMQADTTTGPIILDFKVSFGGVELIVPSHWEIQNEINPAFASVEDERMIRTPQAGEEKKIIILRGSCSFGSIEIKSY